MHVNSGLAAALHGNHASAAAEYQLALRLCNSSVELYVKLFEEQLALLAVRIHEIFTLGTLIGRSSKSENGILLTRRPRHAAIQHLQSCAKQLPRR